MHLNNSGDFPDGPVVKTLRFHCMGSRDQSLVGEPRSWMLHGMAGKKKKSAILGKGFWASLDSKGLRRVRLFVTPWTIQSMELSRPEYWSG